MKNAFWKILMFSVVLGLLSGYSLRAESGFNLVDGEPIHTQAQMDSLHTGDTVVLICPNCHAGKMVTYSADKDSPGHVKWMQPGNTETCSRCGAKLTAVEKDGRVVYECSKCKELGYVTAFKTAKK